MEVTDFNKSVEGVLAKNKGLEEFFTPEELLLLTDQMVKAVVDVAGETKVKKIEFSDDEDMYCQMIEKKVRLGLGNIVRMTKAWSHKLGHTKGNKVTAAQVRAKVISSLRSDAAHEGGHAIIDLPPLELGISAAELNKAGMQSLQNANADCRNDQRIIDQHTDLSEDMRTNMVFAFTHEGGRLAWDDPTVQRESMEELGYVPLFTQFTSELIRRWAHQEVHTDTDPRVREVLEQEAWNLDLIAKSDYATPVPNPTEAEVRSKAKFVYEQVIQMYGREFEKLVAMDIENETVHQAATLVGLDHIGYELHPELKNTIAEAKAKASPGIMAELTAKLEEQAEQKTAELGLGKTISNFFKKMKGVLAGKKPDEEEDEKEEDTTGMIDAPKKKKKKDTGTRDMLGPAIQVETLSPELRQWLIELFKQAKPKADKINMDKLIEEIMKDPEKWIKIIDELNAEGMKPHTIPATYPSYEDLDGIVEGKGPSLPMPSASTVIVPDGTSAYLIPDATPTPDGREFAEQQQWLDDNVDMPEKVREWRDAIKAMGKGGSKTQYESTTDLEVESIIDDEIKVEAGVMPERRIFRKETMTQEKVTISLLWRTQSAQKDATLKLFLFLKRICEDPEINKYLDLEVLLSQDVAGVPQDDDGHIATVKTFDQHPITHHVEIMDNLQRLKGGSTFPINQDATALKVQRERMLRHTHAQAKRRFTIDIWDEAAIQVGVPDPMQAVKDEIAKTREAFKDHSFCITINYGGGTTAKGCYGANNVLSAKDPIELINNLDIVVRHMIKSGDDFAAAVQKEVAAKK